MHNPSDTFDNTTRDMLATLFKGTYMHPTHILIKRQLPYQEGVSLQKQLLAQMAANKSLPATVIFTQHTPVITHGRSGNTENLLATPQQLAQQNIELHPSNRGGDITYHGPGQWTVYPILRLEWYNKDLHQYLRLLEQCVITFLENFNIQAQRRPGLTGAWVNNEKIAAVGVAVSRWITWHGFALNINPNLDHFTQLMHPCGIQATQGGVTSLEKILNTPQDPEKILPQLQKAVAQTLDLQFIDAAL